MPHLLYVCLQDEDKIVAFAIDAETGRLTLESEVPTTGGPSVMAGSLDDARSMSVIAYDRQSRASG
jgi:6-phosphogluconolactonase (cycloisomerase 2 family)